MKLRKGFAPIIIVISALVLGIAFFAINKKLNVPKNIPTEDRSIGSELTESLQQAQSNSASPETPNQNTGNTQKKSSPSPAGSKTQTSSPSPSSNLSQQSSSSQNPPQLKITYPSENQSITMNKQQTLCVVDVPVANTQGLQKKQNINGQGWTSYKEMFATCFDPKEDQNTLEFQYKNSGNSESQIYTRHFNFHRIQDITVTISGQVYKDSNCNNVRDNGETGVSQMTVEMMQTDGLILVDTTTDSNGNYTLSKTIQEDQSITVIPVTLDHKMYFTPPSVTLNKNNPSVTINISSCQ